MLRITNLCTLLLAATLVFAAKKKEEPEEPPETVRESNFLVWALVPSIHLANFAGGEPFHSLYHYGAISLQVT